MGIAQYRKKRDFKKTAEPRGGKVHTRKSGLTFAIQKHAASRLHFDFRLEMEGVLKSWAVPKGPSLDPSIKSLAVQVEDHPLEYGGFEGTIPAGEYGGGTVMLWDRGTWEPEGDDPVKALAAGRLRFKLHGERLQGTWSLVRMGGRAGDGGKNWLLIKSRDEFVSDKSIAEQAMESVKTGRAMEEIAEAKDAVWGRGGLQKTPKSDRKHKTKSAAGAPAKSAAGKSKPAWPEKLSPQLATLADHAPLGDEWLHEIKYDGYRFLAYINGGKARLVTRNGHDWTSKFAGLAEKLSGLKVQSAILDGEVVLLDAEGRSDFQALQARLKGKEKGAIIFFAFDLLFLDGADLRESPLIERKEALKKLLAKTPTGPIRFSEHVLGDGDMVAEKACEMGLEGVVSKQLDSRYASGRQDSWLKSKCGQRQEFVVIGYTGPGGGRNHFGALLLGYFDDNEKLHYAGRVGTGFDERLLADVGAKLKALAVDRPPPGLKVPAREKRDAHWVTPKLVAEIRFTGWTRDGVLRHPAFMGLRLDKPATDVRRETPMKITKTGALPGKSKTTTTSKTKPTGRVVAKKTLTSTKSATTSKSAHTSNSNIVAGVTLSHPDKVLYPEAGVTKHDVATYYELVEQWMVPHLIDRPLALVRCPDGRSGKCFFQRNWSSTLPKAVGKAEVGEGREKEAHVCVPDLAGAVSLVQIGVLEIHTWNCIAGDIEHPDQLVFDLDPGPGITFKQMIQAARILKKALDGLKLPAFLKTSGGKGLHVTVPIEPDIGWDPAKAFCESVAKSLVEASDLFVANMRKDLRAEKVYVDYHRNGRGATAVAPYSTRARDGAPVSMPISWEELGKLKSADQFKVETAAGYLKRRKADPWRDFDKSRVDLRKLV